MILPSYDSDFRRCFRTWDPDDPEALKPVNLYKRPGVRTGYREYFFIVTFQLVPPGGNGYRQLNLYGTFWGDPKQSRFELFHRMLQSINYYRHLDGMGPVPRYAAIVHLTLQLNNDRVYKEESFMNDPDITWAQATRVVIDMFTGRYALRPDVLKEPPLRQRNLVRQAETCRKTCFIATGVFLLMGIILLLTGSVPSGIICLSSIVVLPVLLVVGTWLAGRYEIR